MTRTTKTAAALIATAALAVGLTGCDKASEPYQDAPRSGTVNRQPADIIEAPDGFSNVATKCDHGNRLYISYKGDQNRAAITVVAADPTCKGR